MAQIQFNIVEGTEIQKLERGKEYEIPAGTTHIGLKRGNIAFFTSNDSLPYHKSGNNWHFYGIAMICPAPKKVSFPDFRREEGSGLCYGEPQYA